MLKELTYSGIGAALTSFVLVRALLPARRIWRGDASAASRLPARYGHVKARNYLAYLLWIVPGAGGLLFLCLMRLVATLLGGSPPRGLLLAGGLVFLAALPLGLVHVVVNATGRPRFLVPPPYRAQLGIFAERRRRQARMRSGLPPTEHRVDIIEVPAYKGHPPWLTAACSDPDCHWGADVDDTLDYASADSALRQKAREHTDQVGTEIVVAVSELRRRPSSG